MPGFEQEVRKLLDRRFPCSALSNIPIYRPDVREDRLIGYEIDHLLHVSAELNDRLIIIECKEGVVFGDGPNQPPTDHGAWNVQYRDNPQPRDIKRAQLRNHGRALRAYLHDRAKPLFVEAWLVSRANSTPSREDKRGRHIHFRLFGVDAFCRELVRIGKEETILRVEQSALLGELRKGVPVQDMRHPELNNALAYVERCRKSIDMELFRAFDPKPHLWAINGTAGMGKSVLLAYTLFVFASDRQVVVDTTSQDDDRFLKNFAKEAKAIGLPEHGKRAIYVVARKEKQLKAIEYFWDRFVREYSLLEDGLSLRFQKPIFRRWSRSMLNNEECNVLLIDESHDLDADDQAAVHAWQSSDEKNRYLAIACDRHQKLRLIGTDAVLIEGLNFSLRTMKLRRNYRNPFPVYAAGLALMFRWCAVSGPKMIPSRAQLEQEFGFEVTKYSQDAEGKILLENWNDSHPGNYWSFTISTFLSCDDAYAQLANSALTADQVLWVRFCPEEEKFDYEKLSAFTYHNCNTAESFEFVDKYVKGQEFPIVVIEGFPPEADLDTFQRHPDEAEQSMWSARRELYLCCSRATAFLYFVLPRQQDNRNGIEGEIREIVRQVSEPENPNDVTRRTWRVAITRTSDSRKVDEFLLQSTGGAVTSQPPATLTEVRLSRPVTVKRLADALKLRPEGIVSDLFELGCTFRLSSDVVPDEPAQDVALRYGFVLQMLDTDEITVPLEAPNDGKREPSTPPFQSRVDSQPEDPLSASLLVFLDSGAFPHRKTAVKKYLAILNWVLNSHPAAREQLLNYRREGAFRRYFALSQEEIHEHAASPNPHPIGSSGMWALTTAPNSLKRELLDDILRGCGISLTARQRAVAEIS
jgi:hypothetical protein